MGCCFSKKDNTSTTVDSLNNAADKPPVTHAMYQYDEENPQGLLIAMQSLHIDDVFSDEKFISKYNQRFGDTPLSEKVDSARCLKWIRDFVTKVQCAKFVTNPSRCIITSIIDRVVLFRNNLRVWKPFCSISMINSTVHSKPIFSKISVMNTKWRRRKSMKYGHVCS